MHTDDEVKTAIRLLLAEEGGSPRVGPEQFGRIVTVRALRDALGGGDPTRINRQIQTFRTELFATGRTQDPVADLPEGVANLMHALWAKALGTAREHLAAVEADARQAIEAAERERDDATALSTMRLDECDQLHRQISERDQKLGGLEAGLRAARHELDGERGRREAAETRLAQTDQKREQDLETHRQALAAMGREYEGLRKTLLEQTDVERQSFARRELQLRQELDLVSRLLTEVTRERDRLAREAGENPAVSQNLLGS